MTPGQFQGSCTNGFQDGQEERVDCGGPVCPSCGQYRWVAGDGFQRNDRTGPILGGQDWWQGFGNASLTGSDLRLYGQCALYYSTGFVGAAGTAEYVMFTSDSIDSFSFTVLLYSQPRLEYGDPYVSATNTSLDVWAVSCMTDGVANCSLSLFNPRRMSAPASLGVNVSYMGPGTNYTFYVSVSGWPTPQVSVSVYYTWMVNDQRNGRSAQGSQYLADAPGPISVLGFNASNVNVKQFSVSVYGTLLLLQRLVGASAHCKWSSVARRHGQLQRAHRLVLEVHVHVLACRPHLRRRHAQLVQHRKQLQ
jgi:hypothetical protein